MNAKSIASGDPETSTSGEYFANLMKRLQIADEIKPKIKTFSSGTAALGAVANGEADLALEWSVPQLDLTLNWPAFCQLRLRNITHTQPEF